LNWFYIEECFASHATEEFSGWLVPSWTGIRPAPTQTRQLYLLRSSSTARRQNRLKKLGKEVGKTKRRTGSNDASRLRVSPRKHMHSSGLDHGC